MLTNISNIGSAEVLIVLAFGLFLILSGIANGLGHSKTREGLEFAKAVKRMLNTAH